MCWLCGAAEGAVQGGALPVWVLADLLCYVSVGTLRFRKNWRSHIDAPHSRQPLVTGESLARYEVNVVIGEPMGLRSLITTLF